MKKFGLIVLVFLAGCSGGGSDIPSSQLAAPESSTESTVAESRYVNWSLHGNDHGELRYSALDQINSANVADVGVAWHADIPAIDGFVATPIVVDGVIYISTGFAIVYALNAVSGELLWSFDPEIRLDMGMFNSWAGRFNRGVAVAGEKVFVGTGDCRLVAIDASNGQKIWDVVTCDATKEYSISAAPRVANGKVFIGNSGADSGARGFVSAYDQETGDLVWRFWLVPGDPAEGFENEAMAMAAKTWTGAEPWKYGGGSVWDSMSFDPELNLLYLGTASTSALAAVRSPDGGDNLFLCSIVALDADSGEYRWHYQVTPGETWHFDAANQMVLADLEINGNVRKVLMQAPKNGFFYVIDRVTGNFISAENIVEVNWATGIDSDTGRPIENPEARFYQTEAQNFRLRPLGTIGAHNWHPMSFNPDTGLVYLPTHGMPGWYRMGDSILFAGATAEYYGIDPDDTEELSKIGKLLAWDPVTQSPRWQVDHEFPINGGVLTTAGNLVLQGTASGEFHVYDAESGELLWQDDTQASVQAPPVSYAVDETQYILLPVGAGGSGRISTPRYANIVPGPSRLIAYKMGGAGHLPVKQQWAPTLVEPPIQTASASVIARGRKLFDNAGCKACHGVDAELGFGSSVADLRYLSEESHAEWNAIVLGGSRQRQGMPAFGAWLNVEDSLALQAFVIEKANELWNAQQMGLPE